MKHDDESSGPFSPQEIESQRMQIEPTMQTKSNRFFKGLQVSVPWTAVLLMSCSGAWYLFTHEATVHDENIKRDNKIENSERAIQKLEEAVNRGFENNDRKIDKLTDKIDELRRLK